MSYILYSFIDSEWRQIPRVGVWENKQPAINQADTYTEQAVVVEDEVGRHIHANPYAHEHYGSVYQWPRSA